MSVKSPISEDYVNIDIVGQQWYQGSLERRESENRLRGMPDGTFLVRFSNTQQKYVVSIRYVHVFDKNIKISIYATQGLSLIFSIR